MIALGGLIAIERKFLSAGELAERNQLLRQLDSLPPADDVADFVPGWPCPGREYQDRRLMAKRRLGELTALACARADAAEAPLLGTYPLGTQYPVSPRW